MSQPGTQGKSKDRRKPVDRRTRGDEGDRREDEMLALPTGLERRRGPGRRLSDFTKSAEEGELTKEQFLFVMAIDAFKTSNEVWYPSWTDVLEVVRLLGYRKTMPSELDLARAEDWREPPNAPSNVRTERQIERDRAARDAA
jgi:hypothetical protein